MEEDLKTGCDIAYAKADEILAGRDVDDNGLNREEIAAINLYTQEKMSAVLAPAGTINMYRPMNAALRERNVEQRVEWL